MVAPNALNIANGFNFRDLGGYSTLDGHKIASHRVIRSASLDRLSPADLSYLSDYGVSAVVDFRSTAEKDASPDLLPADATYHFEPVFSTDETLTSQAPESLAQHFSADPHQGFNHMKQTYADLVRTDTAQTAYRHFFDVLLDATDTANAVLFHCTVGKDRTGMGAVYLLSVLGVDAATIRSDYLATNHFMELPRRYILDKVVAGGGNAALQQNLTDLLSATDAYLDSALTTIDTDFGGMQYYLHAQLGLDDDQQGQLRAMYLTH